MNLKGLRKKAGDEALITRSIQQLWQVNDCCFGSGHAGFFCISVSLDLKVFNVRVSVFWSMGAGCSKVL